MINYNSTTKIILFFVLFLVISCTPENEVIDVPIEEPKVINFLALGDSYTIGQGIEESRRWPNQLSEKLKENDFDVANTQIIAQTGWTTSSLLNAIENTALSPKNLVSLLIGVNNQYQNQAFDRFQTEFDTLINTSIELAGTKENVFVVSIPDYGVTPFGSNNSEQIAKELDMYNQYMEDRCNALSIPFIDITEISRELGDSEGALAQDNLHPSGDQYEQWVVKILPVVLDILSK